MKVTCLQCKIEFEKPACHVKRVKKVFCSKKCYDEYQTIFKGKTCEICGDIFKIKGNMSRYVTCDKEDCRAKKKQKENNGMWNGGISSVSQRFYATAKYKKWREAIFKRDNYTCQFCGVRGGILNADHIQPQTFFPELRYDLANGRTLCLECHKTTYKLACSYRDKQRAQGGSNGNRPAK
jgi:hypothetical protein